MPILIFSTYFAAGSLPNLLEDKMLPDKQTQAIGVKLSFSEQIALGAEKKAKQKRSDSLVGKLRSEAVEVRAEVVAAVLQSTASSINGQLNVSAIADIIGARIIDKFRRAASSPSAVRLTIKSGEEQKKRDLGMSVCRLILSIDDLKKLEENAINQEFGKVSIESGRLVVNLGGSQYNEADILSKSTDSFVQRREDKFKAGLQQQSIRLIRLLASNSIVEKADINGDYVIVLGRALERLQKLKKENFKLYEPKNFDKYSAHDGLKTLQHVLFVIEESVGILKDKKMLSFPVDKKILCDSLESILTYAKSGATKLVEEYKQLEKVKILKPKNIAAESKQELEALRKEVKQCGGEIVLKGEAEKVVIEEKKVTQPPVAPPSIPVSSSTSSTAISVAVASAAPQVEQKGLLARAYDALFGSRVPPAPPLPAVGRSK